jgi:elongator complex protein 3
MSSPSPSSPPSRGGADARALCIAEVIQRLISAYKSKAQVNITKLRIALAAKYGLPSQPRLMDLLAAIPEAYKETLTPFLRQKPVRTASGIAVVAVMCKPHRCPHIAMTGNVCVYCPGAIFYHPPGR